MKKVLCLLTALVLLCCCAAAEEMLTLGPTGLQWQLPEAYEAQELSEYQMRQGQVAYLLNGDDLIILYLTKQEEKTLDEALYDYVRDGSLENGELGTYAEHRFVYSLHEAENEAGLWHIAFVLGLHDSVQITFALRSHEPITAERMTSLLSSLTLAE